MRARLLVLSLLLGSTAIPVSALAAGQSDDIAALRREMLEMRVQMQGQISDLRRELVKERAMRRKFELAQAKPVQVTSAPAKPARSGIAQGENAAPGGKILRALPSSGASAATALASNSAIQQSSASPSGTVSSGAPPVPASAETSMVQGKGAVEDALVQLASSPIIRRAGRPSNPQVAYDTHLIPPPDHGLNMSFADFRRATRSAETVDIGGIRIGFPAGRPTIASSDGLYAFSVGLVMHFDIGGFPSSGGAADGQTGRFPKMNENARRLRLPLTWRYGNLLANLTPEWGRTVDGTAGLYEANIVYSGVHNSQFTFGYYQPRVTMQDSESSNGFILMERASISEVVRQIAAGDARMSLGGRTHQNRWYLGAYLTGQTYGDRTTDPTLSDSHIGGLLRVAGRPIATKLVDLHLGVSSTASFKRNQTSQGRVLALTDRPETRLTNERLVSTGTIADIGKVWAAGPEIALRYDKALIQAEYYHIGVTRDDDARRKGPAPNLGFDGYYVAGSYTLFGQTRRYSPKDAAFSAPAPKEDFDLWNNQWGALELVGRWSVMDFNSNILKDQPASVTGGVRGGVQTVWSGGLNWYLNRHYRIQLQYSHIDATRAQTVGTVNSKGRSINSIGSRIQAAF
ncbi:OprO/OprP family phosphate-selective porin [Asaia krungthepensis]|uniref:Polyphosphate-selective porin O n=1 Tax=Asaia krungthepensis NRIC 0535 TaxID=1307925 RepID=A0ABQ0Q6S8_9PROT|nr:OprO/OprP family phosphate-selective porin [Asaia krungthepensis]GBQ93888.1 polyphosphate-selective porin O [Asaia krungthepensis NRIC 0535]